MLIWQGISLAAPVVIQFDRQEYIIQKWCNVQPVQIARIHSKKTQKTNYRLLVWDHRSLELRKKNPNPMDFQYESLLYPYKWRKSNLLLLLHFGNDLALMCIIVRFIYIITASVPQCNSRAECRRCSIMLVQLITEGERERKGGGEWSLGFSWYAQMNAVDGEMAIKEEGGCGVEGNGRHCSMFWLTLRL